MSDPKPPLSEARLLANRQNAQRSTGPRTSAGKDASAIRTADTVVRAEPQNASAWVVLGFAAELRDPALARLAHERVRQLVPPVKAAH